MRRDVRQRGGTALEFATDKRSGDFLVGMMLAPVVLAFVALPVFLLLMFVSRLPEVTMWTLAALTAAVASGAIGAVLGRFRGVSGRTALGVAAMPLLLSALIVFLLIRDFSAWLTFAWLATPGPALLAGYFSGVRRVASEPIPEAPA